MELEKDPRAVSHLENIIEDVVDQNNMLSGLLASLQHTHDRTFGGQEAGPQNDSGSAEVAGPFAQLKALRYQLDQHRILLTRLADITFAFNEL